MARNYLVQSNRSSAGARYEGVSDGEKLRGASEDVICHVPSVPQLPLVL